MNRPKVSGGDWPGLLTLQSGWGKAHARPLRDESTSAALRLERGGPAFLRSCIAWLFDAGAPTVVSGPLTPPARHLWAAAGFRLYQELLVMEKDLRQFCPPPGHTIKEGSGKAWAEAAEIDNMAFAPDWQVGALGLRDAAAATPGSSLLICEMGGVVEGFAIVGVASQVAYLQRIAVRPSRRGLGIGSSLIRATVGWAQHRRARSMLLNTQPENREAISLYTSEGFELLSERLFLLKATLDTQR